MNKVIIDTSGGSGKHKRLQYKLPSLDTIIDFKILTLAWSTSFPPKPNKYCDWKGVNSLIILVVIYHVVHSYHYQCFISNLSGQCIYCHEYLTRGIIENSKIFQNSLNSAGNSIIKNEDDNNESNLENIYYIY